MSGEECEYCGCYMTELELDGSRSDNPRVKEDGYTTHYESNTITIPSCPNPVCLCENYGVFR